MNKTMKQAALTTSALALALTMASVSETDASASALKGKNIKCYGVVAKGKNDCETKNHSCMGEAKTDNAPDEWILMPENICKKLAGSSVGKPRGK